MWALYEKRMLGEYRRYMLHLVGTYTTSGDAQQARRDRAGDGKKYIIKKIRAKKNPAGKFEFYAVVAAGSSRYGRSWKTLANARKAAKRAGGGVIYGHKAGDPISTLTEVATVSPKANPGGTYTSKRKHKKFMKAQGVGLDEILYVRGSGKKSKAQKKAKKNPPGQWTKTAWSSTKAEAVRQGREYIAAGPSMGGRYQAKYTAGKNGYGESGYHLWLKFTTKPQKNPATIRAKRIEIVRNSRGQAVKLRIFKA